MNFWAVFDRATGERRTGLFNDFAAATEAHGYWLVRMIYTTQLLPVEISAEEAADIMEPLPFNWRAYPDIMERTTEPEGGWNA